MSEPHGSVGQTINEVADEMVDDGSVTELQASELVSDLMNEVYDDPL